MAGAGRATHPDSRRWPAWLGALAVALCVLAWLAWFAWPAAPVTGPPVPATPPPAAVRTAAAEPRDPASPAARHAAGSTAAAPRPRAAAPPVPSAPPAQPDPASCEPSGSDAAAEAPTDALAASVRLRQAMAASADPRRRAAAWLLQARLAVDPDALAQAVEDDGACRRAQQSGLEETARDCAERLQHTEAELLATAAPAVEQLARLAAASSDPAVYGMAVEACRHAGLGFVEPVAGCRLLSIEQWAQLDPTNALPWLRLAGEAMQRGDAAAADRAITLAGRAATGDLQSGLLAGLVAEALADGADPAARHALQARLDAHDRAAAPWLGDVVGRYCSAAALADTETTQRCRALAETLVARGRSDDAVTAGIQLGERLGWAATLTSALIVRQQAAGEAPRRAAAERSPPDCKRQPQRPEPARLARRDGVARP